MYNVSEIVNKEGLATKLTYRRGAALRSGMFIITAVVLAELPLWGGLAWLGSPPWSYLGVAVLLVSALAVPSIYSLLLTSHAMHDRALILRFGLRFRLAIPRERIAGVSRYPHPVETPLPGYLLGYDPERDALVVTTANTDLLELRLSEPLEVKVPRHGLCSFSRVLLSLDDPDALLRALGVALEEPPAIEAPPITLPDLEDGPGLVARGLTKRYGGLTAVQDLSLRVRPGEVVALLGANGAGKSTTLQMLVGLTRPDKGAVTINGCDVWTEPIKARASFGYVPDSALFHESLTAREFLWFLGDLYGLDRETTVARTDELLARMGLTARGDSWVLGFSLGMRRKVSIAAGLLHKPQVLILDEITNGLDPRANREVINLIAEAAAAGTAVLLATHVLAVAEELAHRIAILHEGRLRAFGTLPELRELAGLPADASLEAVFLALTGGDVQCA